MRGLFGSELCGKVSKRFEALCNVVGGFEVFCDILVYFEAF